MKTIEELKTLRNYHGKIIMGIVEKYVQKICDNPRMIKEIIAEREKRAQRHVRMYTFLTDAIEKLEKSEYEQFRIRVLTEIDELEKMEYIK